MSVWVTGQNVPPVKISQSVSVKTSLCYWSKRLRESKRTTNHNVPCPWSKRPMWAWPFKTFHLSKRPSVIGQNVPVSQNVPCPWSKRPMWACPFKTFHLSKRPSLFLSKRPCVIGQNVPVSQNVPPTITSHVHGQNVPCGHGHLKRPTCQNVPVCFCQNVPVLLVKMSP